MDHREIGVDGRSRIGAFVASPWAILPALLLAAGLLSIGIDRDYRLKHEDNNALHAGFARAHLGAGLSVTRGHDAYVDKASGRVRFYGHHPSGCGLVLAGVFAITGGDSPRVTRGVAIAATLVTLILLWWIVRREEGPVTALVAALVFAVLPQAAFYGRMVNHEVLALPCIVLLVDRYFALLRRGGRRDMAGLVVAAAAGASFGWITFFALASCAVHAVASLRRRQEFPAAGAALVTILTTGAILLSADIAYIAWVKGGDLSDLVRILSSRIGVDQSYDPFEWAHKMLGFSRRLATASGTAAIVWLAVRTVRAASSKTVLRPVEEIAAVFLGAGLGYLVVFNWGAWQHHYWQFPLLPAVVISLSLAIVTIAGAANNGPRRIAHGVLLAVILLEIIGTSTVMLYKRHTTPEERVIQVVDVTRTQFL